MKLKPVKVKPLKKSIFNITVTMALTTGLYSGSMLYTQAYAATDTTAGNTDIVANETTDNDSNYLYSGLGIGAVGGAAVAGPVGLVIGGLVGAVIGVNQAQANSIEPPESAIPAGTGENTTGLSQNRVASEATEAGQPETERGVQVARLGDITPADTDALTQSQQKLLNILTTDFDLDIYFRSGSADMESFYSSRIASIAKLVNTMPQLEIHLDGYSDRRGDRQQNQELASKRIEEVRRQLLSAGIDESRIVSTAFGEMKTVSAPGDLEGYSFDRKVVIRFERGAPDAIATMKQALTVPAENTGEKTGNSSVSSVTADTLAQF